jgi:uncharacterized membrane protein
VIERYKRDESEFDRAIAFIDAVFAFALTLLVTTLEIGSRPSEWDSLGDLYDAAGPQFLAFAISFVVIAGYWLAHYRLFRSVAAFDVRLIVVNLVMLAGIVVLPFTTEYTGDPSIDELPLPTAIFAVNLAVVSSMFALVYVMARGRGLLREEPTSRDFAWYVLGILTPAIVFLVSIPIAYLANPDVARLSWLSLAVINPILGAARRDSPTT